MNFEEFTTIHGFGEAKAAHVKAALEIGRRLLLAQPEQRPQITSPGDVANLLLLEMSHLEQEHLRVVILNTKNLLARISPGSSSRCDSMTLLFTPGACHAPHPCVGL